MDRNIFIGIMVFLLFCAWWSSCSKLMQDEIIPEKVPPRKIYLYRVITGAALWSWGLYLLFQAEW